MNTKSNGDASEAKVKESEEEILSVLEETGKATIATIAKTVSKDFSNTRKRILSLWAKDKLHKEDIEGKTYYFLPGMRTEK